MSVKRRAFIYIIAAGILWGTSGLFIRDLTRYGFTPMQILAFRGFVAFLCLGGFILVRNRKLFAVKLRDLPLLLSNGLVLFVTSGCYYNAIPRTSVSTAVVLMYMAPAYVMLFSVFVWHEKFSWLKGVSLGAVLAGGCLVSGIVSGLKFDAVGILLGVLSGIFYGANLVMSKMGVRRGYHAFTVTFYSFAVMAFSSICVCNPIQAVKIVGESPMPLIPVLLLLGLITYVLPYSLCTVAMQSLPAGTASALCIVEPMAATVFSMMFLQEIPDVYAVIGIVLILSAVVLLGKAEGKE